MTRFHLGFPSHAVADVAMRDWGALAASVERAGFDALWHSNERFFREMFVRMTVSALATERIVLGGAVVEGYAAHPALTAQSLATVAELAPGRVTAAVGAGGSGLPMMGVARREIARTVRETTLAIAELLEGRTVTRRSGAFLLEQARLRVSPGPRVPLWIASRGPRTLRAAGEVADGAMIASRATPRGLASALEQVRAGAAAAGRPAGEPRAMARVDSCVHPDPALAREGCRLMVAKLLWMSFPDRGFLADAGLAVPAELEEVIALRDYDALERVAGLVPDELVDALCWAGTPDELVRRVSAVVAESGVSDVGFWLLPAPGQSLGEAIGLLGGILPALREAAR